MINPSVAFPHLVSRRETKRLATWRLFDAIASLPRAETKKRGYSEDEAANAHDDTHDAQGIVRGYGESYPAD